MVSILSDDTSRVWGYNDTSFARMRQLQQQCIAAADY
jgi:hypothetical protein